MEVRQLRYFVIVAELGHFGRAAEQLHIVQPAVSKQIASLERELGLTLFDRSRRQATLTPDGQAFLPHARRALRGIDRAARAADELVAGNTGILRVGSSPGLGKHLEDILATFRRNHPEVTIQLSTIQSALTMIAALRAGSLDAAFMSAPPKDPRLAIHYLRDERLVVAVATERAGIAADLRKLADLPLARPARDENPEAFDLITNACTTAGFMPLAGPTLVNAQDILFGPIAAGHCWTLLPSAVANTDSAVVTFVEPDPPILLPVALLFPRSAARQLAMNLLEVARATETKLV